MAITPLPSAPQITDDTATFNTKAFSFVDALDPMVTEINAVLPDIAQAGDASAAALGAANFKGEWSTLTGSLDIPASVSHNDSVWLLTQSLADITTNEPGVDSPNYWINLTPTTAGSLLRQIVFTTSGTWTKGAGTNYILIQGVGGGGGGSVSASGGGGGGAGGYASKFIDVSSISTESVTIGAGGAGKTGGAGSGSAGGQTTFGLHISCNGGSPATSSVIEGGGTGGTASNGDVNIIGGSGFNGTNNYTGNGGASFFGGGGVVIRGLLSESGRAYGSGGAGSANSTTYTAGNGANGLVIVLEYA